MSRHHGKAERRQLARARARSCSSAAAFASEHGITAGTLRRWKADASQDTACEAAEPSTALRFVRLSPATPVVSVHTGLVVEVSGARVHVDAGTDTELLAMVVSTPRRVS
jgi:transposase-like protein